MQEFTTFMLQIPNLTDDDMLFHFMDRLQNWARTELERRQVRTIDEAITQAEALTDFRQERPDRARGEEIRGGHDHMGEIMEKAKSNDHIPRTMIPISLMARSLDVMATRRERQRLPKEMVVTYAAGHMAMQERKEKDAQEQGQGVETTQLGLISLCGAITKQPEKPRGYGAQYVDLMINGRLVCAMIDTGAEVNIMTKTTATRLGLSYNPSNAQLRTVNAPPTPVSGVAHGVSITLAEWQGKTNFIVAHLDLFDIILGQEFFQQCHAVIDPYLRRLLVMEQGRSCMVPLVKVPKTEGQVRLTAMQVIRGPKKKDPTFRATITSSKEDNDAKRSLPPRTKNVPKKKQYRDAKEAAEALAS
ncbi:hypothetical protein KY284_012398 [Solanum tuberosum]|nr:hypothetical protein KY284_012398 [Solanum tuberosum]